MGFEKVLRACLSLRFYSICLPTHFLYFILSLYFYVYFALLSLSLKVFTFFILLLSIGKNFAAEIGRAGISFYRFHDSYLLGEVDQTRMAVSMIIEKIVEDPQSSSCPNISYADATGPIPSANPTGVTSW